MKVLLVGHATSREMLAAARCLGRAGHDVSVASGSRRSLAGGSSLVYGDHQIPPPDAVVDRFISAVDDVVASTRADVVIGCGDPELLALSRHRDQIRARVPLATHERVVHAIDKLSLVTEAAAVGLAVPDTVVADDAQVAAWRGPAVVKARLHWEPGLQAASDGFKSARLAGEGVPLAEAVRAVLDAGRSPILQRPVAGGLIAVSGVCDASGHLVALQQQRASHTWPPGAGISTRAYTVRPDPDLVDGVQRLLHRLGWVGMVQLQFLTPADGPPRLIDLNGRPYGSLSLALASGLALPALWLDTFDDTERPVADIRFGAPGVRYSWGGGDLVRAVVERRGGLLADVTSTVRSWPGAAHPVADRADRGPVRRLPLLAGDALWVRVRRRVGAVMARRPR